MEVVESRDITSPDSHGIGLVDAPLNPLRYDGHSEDPNEVAGILRTLMPRNVRVLDVGCGTGSVTLIANSGKNNDVVAIEPDAERAALARARGLNVVCGFLDDNFLETHGSFDVIVFADVLEHLPSPDAMLALALKGLNVGGIVIASVPNVAHWTLRLKLLFGQFDYKESGLCDATHLRWFTRRSIKALFNSHRLELLNLRYSAGLTLPVYQSRYAQFIPKRLLRPSLHAVVKYFPSLFTCQFVIQARKPM